MTDSDPKDDPARGNEGPAPDGSTPRRGLPWLLDRVHQGSRSAVWTLLDHLRPTVRARIERDHRRARPDPVMGVSDLTTLTLLGLAAGKLKGDTSGEIEAYAAKAAHNTFLGRRRALDRDCRTPLAEASPSGASDTGAELHEVAASAGATPLDLAHENELGAFVAAHVARMTPEERAAWQSLGDGESVRTLARKLGCTDYEARRLREGVKSRIADEYDRRFGAGEQRET